MSSVIMSAEVGAGVRLQNKAPLRPMVKTSPALPRHRWTFGGAATLNSHPGTPVLRSCAVVGDISGPEDSSLDPPPSQVQPATQEPKEDFAKLVYHTLLFFR